MPDNALSVSGAESANLVTVFPPRWSFAIVDSLLNVVIILVVLFYHQPASKVTEGVSYFIIGLEIYIFVVLFIVLPILKNFN